LFKHEIVTTMVAIHAASRRFVKRSIRINDR